MDVSSVLKGGSRGAAVIPGKPDESRLIQLVVPGGKPHMPPGKHQLNEKEIDVLRNWIATLPPDSGESAEDSPSTDPTVGYQIPSHVSPTSVINLLIEAGYEGGTAPAAELSDDATFIRRVTLDLAGRIPTADETREFLAETSSLKRTRLVERLIDSDDYADSMALAFDVIMLGEKKTNGRLDVIKDGMPI